MSHAIFFLPAALPLPAGCVSHEETTGHDVARGPVEFESETAGRIFYGSLSKAHPARGHESRTDISIPAVFESKRREIAGPNVAFNDHGACCDTSKDGRITDLEAEIFAQNLPN